MKRIYKLKSLIKSKLIEIKINFIGFVRSKNFNAIG